jgi:hypothetical protein
MPDRTPCGHASWLCGPGRGCQAKALVKSVAGQWFPEPEPEVIDAELVEPKVVVVVDPQEVANRELLDFDFTSLSEQHAKIAKWRLVGDSYPWAIVRIMLGLVWKAAEGAIWFALIVCLMYFFGMKAWDLLAAHLWIAYRIAFVISALWMMIAFIDQFNREFHRDLGPSDPDDPAVVGMCDVCFKYGVAMYQKGPSANESLCYKCFNEQRLAKRTGAEWIKGLAVIVVVFVVTVVLPFIRLCVTHPDAWRLGLN